MFFHCPSSPLRATQNYLRGLGLETLNRLGRQSNLDNNGPRKDVADLVTMRNRRQISSLSVNREHGPNYAAKQLWVYSCKLHLSSNPNNLPSPLSPDKRCNQSKPFFYPFFWRREGGCAEYATRYNIRRFRFSV